MEKSGKVGGQSRRVTLQFTPGVLIRMNKLKIQCGFSTYPDLFRAALAVFESIMEHVDKGYKLYLVRDRDARQKEVVLPFLK